MKDHQKEEIKGKLEKIDHWISNPTGILYQLNLFKQTHELGPILTEQLADILANLEDDWGDLSDAVTYYVKHSKAPPRQDDMPEALLNELRPNGRRNLQKEIVLVMDNISKGSIDSILTQLYVQTGHVYKRSSVTSTLSRLARDGKIKSNGQGTYSSPVV